MRVKFLSIAAASFLVLSTAAANASIAYADYVYTGADFVFSSTCDQCVRVSPPLLSDSAEVIIVNDAVASLTMGGVSSLSGFVNGGINLDPLGHVVDWNLNFFVAGGCCYRASASFTPAGAFMSVTSLDNNFGLYTDTWTAPPGTWSGSPVVTPVPAALPLFATGLTALGLLGWRRRRKAAAIA